MKLKAFKKNLCNISFVAVIAVVMFYTGRLTRKYIPGSNNSDLSAEDIHTLSDGEMPASLTAADEENTEIVEVITELESVPWVYDSQFKNPCWRFGEELKCLPYFYIVGMPLTGAGSLFSAIMEHPEAVNPGFAEANFFWKKDIADVERGDLFTYVDMYDNAAKQILDNSTGQEDPYAHIQLVTGDASSYLTRWWNTSHTTRQNLDPGFNILDYIFHLVPTAKIIVIFRNPVERLYGEYCTRTKWQLDPDWPSPEHFHDKVTNAIKVYNMMFRYRPIRKCVQSEEGLELAQFGLLFGLYYYYWEEVIRTFPRNQILVLQYRTLFTEETIRLVFAFLGMSEPYPDVLRRLGVLRSGGFNPCGNRKMLGRTRTLLHKFYEPYNEMMAEYMDDDRFLYPMNMT